MIGNQQFWGDEPEPCFVKLVITIKQLPQFYDKSDPSRSNVMISVAFIVPCY